MVTHGVPRDEAAHAAALVRQLCDARAWSAHDLAEATAKVAKQRRDPRLIVSRRTVNRVVAGQGIPGARVKCAIALALNLAPWQIWGEGALPLLHEQRVTVVAA